jgi:hypothetical protein
METHSLGRHIIFSPLGKLRQSLMKSNTTFILYIFSLSYPSSLHPIVRIITTLPQFLPIINQFLYLCYTFLPSLFSFFNSYFWSVPEKGQPTLIFYTQSISGLMKSTSHLNRAGGFLGLGNVCSPMFVHFVSLLLFLYSLTWHTF